MPILHSKWGSMPEWGRPPLPHSAHSSTVPFQHARGPGPPPAASPKTLLGLLIVIAIALINLQHHRRIGTPFLVVAPDRQVTGKPKCPVRCTHASVVTVALERNGVPPVDVGDELKPIRVAGSNQILGERDPNVALDISGASGGTHQKHEF
jgi:hypothetical protein